MLLQAVKGSKARLEMPHAGHRRAARWMNRQTATLARMVRSGERSGERGTATEAVAFDRGTAVRGRIDKWPREQEGAGVTISPERADPVVWPRSSPALGDLPPYRITTRRLRSIPTCSWAARLERRRHLSHRAGLRRDILTSRDTVPRRAPRHRFKEVTMMSTGKAILAALRQQLNLSDYRKKHWEGTLRRVPGHRRASTPR